MSIFKTVTINKPSSIPVAQRFPPSIALHPSGLVVTGYQLNETYDNEFAVGQIQDDGSIEFDRVVGMGQGDFPSMAMSSGGHLMEMHTTSNIISFVLYFHNGYVSSASEYGLGKEYELGNPEGVQSGSSPDVCFPFEDTAIMCCNAGAGKITLNYMVGLFRDGLWDWYWYKKTDAVIENPAIDANVNNIVVITSGITDTNDTLQVNVMQLNDLMLDFKYFDTSISESSGGASVVDDDNCIYTIYESKGGIYLKTGHIDEDTFKITWNEGRSFVANGCSPTLDIKGNTIAYSYADHTPELGENNLYWGTASVSS